jgi:hypothetical protein
LKAVGFVLDKLLGPGLKKIGELFSLISKGVSDFLDDGQVSYAMWTKIHDKGVLPIVLALVKMVELSKAFFEGIGIALEGFLGGVGEPFNELVDTFFQLLSALGLVSQELGGTTNTARKLGIIVGTGIRWIGNFLSTFIVPILALIIKYVEFFVGSIATGIDRLRSLMQFMGLDVGTPFAPDLAPTAKPFVTVRGTTTPETVGRDIGRAYGQAALQEAEGGALPRSGLIANLNVKTAINMDGRQVGEAMARAERRRLTNRTGLSPIAYGDLAD